MTDEGEKSLLRIGQPAVYNCGRFLYNGRGGNSCRLRFCDRKASGLSVLGIALEP